MAHRNKRATSPARHLKYPPDIRHCQLLWQQTPRVTKDPRTPEPRRFKGSKVVVMATETQAREMSLKCDVTLSLNADPSVAPVKLGEGP